MNKFVFDPTRKFLDPERVLFAAGLGTGQTFADFGSGSGFYTVGASKIVGEQGTVYSVDILESVLDHIGTIDSSLLPHNFRSSDGIKTAARTKVGESLASPQTGGEQNPFGIQEFASGIKNKFIHLC